MSGILDQRSAMPVHYSLGRFVSHFGVQSDNKSVRLQTEIMNVYSIAADVFL